MSFLSDREGNALTPAGTRHDLGQVASSRRGHGRPSRGNFTIVSLCRHENAVRIRRSQPLAFALLARRVRTGQLAAAAVIGARQR
jgi:hypothetical protein